MIEQKITETLKLASFFSIILVILIHASNIHLITEDKSDIVYQISFLIQEIISMKIGLSAVPFFFLASGYLFYQKYTHTSYFPKIKKRINTLLLPYLFWSSIVVLIFFILQSIPSLRLFFSNNIIEDMNISEILNVIFINPINYPLWFVRDLIIIVLFSHIIYFLINRYAYFTLVVTFILWMNNICPSTQFCLYKSEPFFFFILGAYLSIKKINFDYFLDNKIIIYLILLIYSYFIISTEITNLYLFQSFILLGVGVIWITSKWFLRFNLAKNLTIYTFVIYVFHEPGLTILKKVLFSILGYTPYASLLIYIVSPIVMVVFLVFFGKFMKYYFPNFIRITTGNRL